MSDETETIAAPPSRRLPADVPAPGELFDGKYRIERVIGAGGMGYVLAAIRPELEDRVAIKILRPERLESDDTVGRFLREGRTAAKLRSEHVARVLDVGESEGRPYIVMEYLEGADLGRVVGERGPLPVDVAVDWVLQACEAIAEAHALFTIHRDLKPANLFLVRQPDGREWIKVLDFGISKVTPHEGRTQTEITTTSAALGTPRYMSPEQLRSARDVDARADLWAIGVILFELVAGRTPFEGESAVEVGVHVLTKRPPDLREHVPGAPPALAQAIDRCLRRDPRERFPSLAELAIAIAPFGTAAARASASRIDKRLRDVPRPESIEPSVAVEVPPPAPPRRRPWLVAAAAGAAVVLLGATAVVVLARRESVVAEPPSLARSSDEPSIDASAGTTASIDDAPAPVPLPRASPAASAPRSPPRKRAPAHGVPTIERTF